MNAWGVHEHWKLLCFFLLFLSCSTSGLLSSSSFSEGSHQIQCLAFWEKTNKFLSLLYSQNDKWGPSHFPTPGKFRVTVLPLFYKLNLGRSKAHFDLHWKTPCHIEGSYLWARLCPEETREALNSILSSL